MKPTDRESFLKTLVGFAELKGKKLSSAAFELYWDAMEDWSIQDFNAAAKRLIKTCEFMPTPKDFEDLRKAGRPTAGEVFANLMQWMHYNPEGYSIKADTPPAIAAAIRASGGANAYALCKTTDIHYFERRFCEHYAQISDRMEIRNEVPEIALDPELRAKIAGTFKNIGQDQKIES